VKHLIRNTKKGEGLVYTIIWLVVFLMPVFLSRSSSGFNWQRVVSEWGRFLPFFLIFLLHNFMLFPQLFMQDKRGAYFVISFVVILLIGGAWILGGRYLFQPAGPSAISRPDLMPVRPEMLMRIRPWFVNLANMVLVSVLVIGFNAAIKLTVKWQEEEQKNKELEKEKLQTELAFLKNQVSPHFFMNTLNNIHALIDINSEDAKESIIKLSKLMRYLLYDSEQGKTTLPKEIEFIKSYVDLMKMRFTSDVKIKLSFPETIPEIEIPPMLFTSLVENAFKHGISYQADSFVGIYMRIFEKQLFFRIENSIHKNNAEQMEKGGLGLPNLSKRLGLLYGSDFTLSSSENENTFEINVKIPLHGN
jgi:uncharacterized protein (DUF2164 family)